MKYSTSCQQIIPAFGAAIFMVYFAILGITEIFEPDYYGAIFYLALSLILAIIAIYFYLFKKITINNYAIIFSIGNLFNMKILWKDITEIINIHRTQISENENRIILFVDQSNSVALKISNYHFSYKQLDEIEDYLTKHKPQRIKFTDKTTIFKI